MIHKSNASTPGQLTATHNTVDLSCTRVSSAIQSLNTLTPPAPGSLLGATDTFNQEVTRLQHDVSSYCTHAFDGSLCVSWQTGLASIKGKLDEISATYSAQIGQPCESATHTALHTKVSELRALLQYQRDAYQTTTKSIEQGIDARESAIDARERLTSLQASAARADCLAKRSHAAMKRDFYNSIADVQLKESTNANREFRDTVAGMLR